MFIVDISGTWHENQIPLCKWIDTGSHDVKLELKTDKANNFADIVMVMACVGKSIPGIEYTSRYEWPSRHRLKFDTCRSRSTGDIVVELFRDASI